MSDIIIGGIPLTTGSSNRKRISMLLWGDPGCGKTSLAATAPGKKLWINFDPDGMNTLEEADNYVALDFAKAPNSITEKFKTEDVLGIGKLLEQDPEIETVVIDSLTSFGDMAMAHAIHHASAAGIKGVTLEDPGFKGYGRKHTWTYNMVNNVLKLTAKYDRHCIFIAHEDGPTKDDKGAVLYITMMLGSGLVSDIPVKLSEVWYMQDTGRERRIAVRPCRMRKPMKTRMFLTTGEPEFKWDYNKIERTGKTLEAYYEEWKANGFKAIPVPK